MLRQFGKDPHPSHQRQPLAQPRGRFDHGHLAPTLDQEFGQFHADQFAADYHHFLAQRHPGVGCLADQRQVGSRPLAAPIRVAMR